MNKYESVIIINDNLTQEQKENTIKKVEKFINENGQLEKTDIFGSKKLAYEVKKQKTGYYCIFYFVTNPETITELERIYRITDEIIKFIVVKQDD